MSHRPNAFSVGSVGCLSNPGLSLRSNHWAEISERLRRYRIAGLRVSERLPRYPLAGLKPTPSAYDSSFQTDPVPKLRILHNARVAS